MESRCSTLNIWSCFERNKNKKKLEFDFERQDSFLDKTLKKEVWIRIFEIRISYIYNLFYFYIYIFIIFSISIPKT